MLQQLTANGFVQYAIAMMYVHQAPIVIRMDPAKMQSVSIGQNYQANL